MKKLLGDLESPFDPKEAEELKKPIQSFKI